MSVGLLSSTITSIEGEQLYEYPKGMKSIMRVAVGGRSLNYSRTTIYGRKYIVLLEALQISGVDIHVVGR